MNSCGKSIHVRVFTLGDYMKPCIICSLRDIYIIRFTFIIIRTFVRTLLLISRVMLTNLTYIRRYEFMCDFWITNNPLLIGRDAVLDSCDLIWRGAQGRFCPSCSEGTREITVHDARRRLFRGRFRTKRADSTRLSSAKERTSQEYFRGRRQRRPDGGV